MEVHSRVRFAQRMGYRTDDPWRLLLQYSLAHVVVVHLLWQCT